MSTDAAKGDGARDASASGEGGTGAPARSKKSGKGEREDKRLPAMLWAAVTLVVVLGALAFLAALPPMD